MKAISIDHHRNGIAGRPFYVAILKDGKKRKVVIRADGDPTGIFVLDIDLLNAGVIEFGKNSFYGEDYSEAMSAAITDFENRWGVCFQ